MSQAVHPVGPMRHRMRAATRGVVLLALLLALALGGIAVMAAVDVWSLQRQRAQEEQLLFAGEQYRQAIRRYYFGAPPGTRRTLPSRIEDLLEDDRYPVPVRYLRRRYPDPISGSDEWGVIRIDNRLAGIYSASEKRPVKQAGFSPAYEAFTGKEHYRDWVFAISPAGQPLFVDPAAVPAPAGLVGDSPARPHPRAPS